MPLLFCVVALVGRRVFAVGGCLLLLFCWLLA